MPLQNFIDSATQNTIAFAALDLPMEQVVQEMQKFFSSQKSFLTSKAAKGEPLLPKLIMKNKDSMLMALNYESVKMPLYLSERDESAALLLLLKLRQSTWLFIIDGKAVEGREFLLNRIVTGFR